METKTASGCLAALGHETRLAIFRQLIQAGPQGMSAGMIAELLSLAGATLSFHLAHLTRVGLIKGNQKSRFIFYSADYQIMDDLLSFLTHNCCQGDTCLPKSSLSRATPKG